MPWRSPPSTSGMFLVQVGPSVRTFKTDGNSQRAPVSASQLTLPQAVPPRSELPRVLGLFQCRVLTISSPVSWFLFLTSQDRQHPAPALRHGQGPASSRGAWGPGSRRPSLPPPSRDVSPASVFVSGKAGHQPWWWGQLPCPPQDAPSIRGAPLKGGPGKAGRKCSLLRGRPGRLAFLPSRWS